MVCSHILLEDNNNEDRDDGSATEDNGCFEPYSF